VRWASSAAEEWSRPFSREEHTFRASESPSDGSKSSFWRKQINKNKTKTKNCRLKKQKKKKQKKNRKKPSEGKSEKNRKKKKQQKPSENIFWL
jgi:hypothetical protein